ncbi:MAG: peroxidase family protein, partial [Pseudomonadota bacterium]
ACTDIDDVDLWAGLLSERPVGDGLAGETQLLILHAQFERTRAGDPDWFETNGDAAWVANRQQTTLAHVIARNTGVDDLPASAMRAGV